MLYVGAMKVWRILKKSHRDYQQEKLPRFGDEVARKQLRLRLETNKLLKMLAVTEQSWNTWQRPNMLEKVGYT